MGHKAINIIGEKYGKLVVLEKVGMNKNHQSLYLCQCECGNTTIVTKSNLRSGSVKSCGCLKHEGKHGLSNTPIYNTWRDMKIRCYNEKSPSYKNYGGRGITVYSEWLDDFTTFYNWSINNGYKKGLSIDRINVNGNYEPNNCRWVTRKEQANNKRNNILITYNNETHNISEWGNITGINQARIRERIVKLKWTVEKALTTPIRPKKKNK